MTNRSGRRAKTTVVGQGNRTGKESLGRLLRHGFRDGILVGQRWFQLGDIAKNLAVAEVALSGRATPKIRRAFGAAFNLDRIDPDFLLDFVRAVDETLAVPLGRPVPGELDNAQIGAVNLPPDLLGGAPLFASIVLLGRLVNGERFEILDVSLARACVSEDYLRIVAHLERRGLRRLGFASGCDDSDLQTLLDASHPETTIQRSISSFLFEASNFFCGDEGLIIGDRCSEELEAVFEKASKAEAEAAFARWSEKWEEREGIGDVCDFAHDTLESMLGFYELPQAQWEAMKTNSPMRYLIARVNRAIYSVECFAGADSLMRLARSVAVETEEEWRLARRFTH